MPEFDEELFKPGGVMFLPTPNTVPRVLGYLYVTQHNNYGDVQFSDPIEPAKQTTKHVIGEETCEIDRETHIVVLFSTFRCRVAFVPKGEDIAQAESHAFPLAPETEISRIVHLNTEMTIVTFPDY